MKHNQAELINENVNAALCVNNLCNMGQSPTSGRPAASDWKYNLARL